MSTNGILNKGSNGTLTQSSVVSKVIGGLGQDVSTGLTTDNVLIVDGTGAITIGPLTTTSIPTGIPATKIGDGSVDNTELSYVNGVTSAIQTQLNDKLSNLVPVPATSGGTGQSSYTTGDLLYASSSTALSKLTAGAANTLLQSNGSAAPSWTSTPTISGTNITDGTIRIDSLVSQGTSKNLIIRWNGTNWGTTSSSAANFLLTSGATSPTWSNILNGIIIDANLNPLSNITTSMLVSGFNLAATQGGTGQTSYTVGDLLYASTTTALSKLAATTSGYVLTAAGSSTAPSWSAPITNTADFNTLAGSYNVTTSFANTGLSLNLPSAGKYKIWGEIRCQLQVTSGIGNITIRFYNSTLGSAITESERISDYSANSVIYSSTVPISEIITISGATTITLQAMIPAGPTYSSAIVVSDVSGRSKIFYEKIGP